MTVEILSRTEAVPASYPAAPSGLSTAAAALDSSIVWKRIESYVAHRWTARTVTYVVQGSGDWAPDLTPFVVGSKQVWTNGAWVPGAVLTANPLGGFELDGETYQITGDAGSGVTVPETVNEAYRRLAEYMAADQDTKPGASRFAVDLGPLTMSYDRAPTWLARAMVNSGAGDLLRPYRRV